MGQGWSRLGPETVVEWVEVWRVGGSGLLCPHGNNLGRAKEIVNHFVDLSPGWDLCLGFWERT